MGAPFAPWQKDFMMYGGTVLECLGFLLLLLLCVAKIRAKLPRHPARVVVTGVALSIIGYLMWSAGTVMRTVYAPEGNAGRPEQTDGQLSPEAAASDEASS